MQRYSLKRMARQNRVRRARGPIMRPSLNTERDLYRACMSVIAPAFREHRAAILQAALAARPGIRDGAVQVTDAETEKFNLVMRLYSATLGRLTEVAGRMVNRALSVAGARHTENWIAGVNKAIGVNLEGIVQQSDVKPAIDLSTRLSFSSIKGITEDQTKRMEGRLIPMILRGAPAKDMTKVLSEEFGYARNRAKFIARDQAASFSGNLNRIRQQQAGISEYDWLTADDERVRPAHREREGKRFRWSDPPEGGHPGEDFNCRCTAIAVID